MKKRALVFAICFLYLLLGYGIRVSAEDHVHNWDYTGTTYRNLSNDQHAIIEMYECYECGAVKEEEKEKQNHSWMQYQGVSYSNYSDSQHTITRYYYCADCEAEKEEVEEKQNHSWVEYQGVTYSNYSDSQHTITHSYYCVDCEAEKEEQEQQDHLWVEDKYADEYGEDMYDKLSDTQHFANHYYYCELCEQRKKVREKKNHSWIVDDEKEDTYAKLSDKKHIIIHHYRCEDCWQEKEEREEQNHKWEEYADEKYSKLSSSQHTVTRYYICEHCDQTKKEQEKKDHHWVTDGTRGYKKISSKDHSFKHDYYCDDCNAKKTVTEKGKHHWVALYVDDYKSISKTKHSYDQRYYCDVCDGTRTVKREQKHTFDSYGQCKKCDFCKTSTISFSLANKKTAKVNPNTWCKLVVKKNGYLKLQTSGNAILSLYNKSKKKYPEADLYCYVEDKFKGSIPVLKGTYYLKSDHTTKLTIQFKSDPSKKNYTKKAALKMQKNKVYTTIIYCANNSESWERYFKIDLTKKQKIRFDYDGWYCALINAKDKSIYTVRDYNKQGDCIGYVTEESVPKGTYYLVLEESWGKTSRNYQTGKICTIVWK